MSARRRRNSAPPLLPGFASAISTPFPSTTSSPPSSPLNPSLRESTIYSNYQGANRDPLLEVDCQRSFTGPYVISTALADKKCIRFGVQGLLNELNTIMGTSFPPSPSVYFHLVTCIYNNYDFGLAYSYLRPHWHSDLGTLAVRLEKAESDDAALRQDALDPLRNYVANPYLPPRRVWDLYSNRVIPYYWWKGHVARCLPVSHSWVAENERSDSWTPINGYAWPVSVPSDSSLERVRIELLNHTASNQMPGYSWLDVLCLRQTGQSLDDGQRLQEWMTDVPTIGHIYNYNAYATTALIYFNGLGRPFHNGDYDDPRHWFNRAWTVQEVVSYPLLGGATSSSPTLPPPNDPPTELAEFYARFKSIFRTKIGEASSFSHYIEMMRKRQATKELDKISGLARVSWPERLPIYDLTQSSEGAWKILMTAIGRRSRAHLFFWYPIGGDCGYSWMPSWSQVMAEEIPAAEDPIEYKIAIDYDEENQLFCGKFRVLDNCMVLGLDFPSLRWTSRCSRKGQIIVRDQKTRRLQQFEVYAQHRVPIREHLRYSLIFSDGTTRLVVGVPDSARRVEKLCVLDFRKSNSVNIIRRITAIREVILT